MSDFDIDALLDAAVLEGALAGGRDPRLAARQFGASRVAAIGRPPGAPAGFANQWTADDDAALAAWAGEMGEAEIAARLGRSTPAVISRRYHRGLPSPTRHPDYVTGQAMADALGLDSHSVLRLIERGLLPVERTPLQSDRLVWRMRRTAFYVWATNPENWVYFARSVRNPERIRDERLARLIARRAADWPDAWWTIGEVADYHGVIHQDINKYVRRGRLPAVKWGNWWIKRSDAMRLRVYTLADGQLPHRGTSRLDAFLVLAVAVGVPYAHIARMVRGRSESGVVTRYQALVAHGLAPWIIRAHDLPVRYRAADGAIWADWRPVAHRFPAVARAWGRLAAGEHLARFDRAVLAGVLRSFARFHHPDHPLLPRLGRGDASPATLRAIAALYPEPEADR